LLRSFDYLIWALIFVRAIGLGPMAGIMAIAIVETGTFIKLYSEAIENLDRKQIDAVRASGGNGLHVIRYGVLPQVLPMMLSITSSAPSASRPSAARQASRALVPVPQGERS